VRRQVSIVLLSVLSFSGLALAQDDAAAPVSAEATEATIAAPAATDSPAATDAPVSTGVPAATDAPAASTGAQTASTVRPRLNNLQVRNRWDNGLDVKLTDAWDRRATDVEAPTIVLSAEWNYKFVTNTYLGIIASGFPQSMRIETDVEDVDASVTGYWGGINLGQGLFETWPYRLVFTLSAGQGLAYIRIKAGDEPATADAVKFDFYEPGFFGMLFAYQGLEMGVTASYRKVSMKEEGDFVPEDDDLTSVAYGLTFRTQRF
jgi:hypothetical protein